MSGLCGWFNLAGLADPASLLQEMAGGLPPMGEYGKGRLTALGALQVKTGVPDSSLSGDQQIACALDGTPRWMDATLASAAAEHGAALTLLKAYRERGNDCLQPLRGCWALAILDHAQQTALLAVDRMGTRPLCYALTAQGGLVFGSTTEAVRRHPALDARLDPQAIYNYIYFHMVPSPGTVYRQIHKLLPGQALSYRDGKISIAPYWAAEFVERGGASFATLKQDLRDGLRQAVRNCHPDATTGTFLSGGLDSSTVTGILAELGDQSAPAYTMGFAAQGYDEMDYARLAAKHFRVDLREYYVTPEDVAAAFPEVAQAYDEPFGNSSAIPTLLCARLAHQLGTRSLLAGDGGDEIFAGNERYARQKLFGLYQHVPHWLRTGALEPLLVDRPAGNWPKLLHKARRYIEQARETMPLRMETYNFLYLNAPQTIFSASLLAEVDTDTPLQLLSDTYQRAPSPNLLHKMLFLDWKFTLADNDLRKVNRMCELAGIKVHYPMLDDELVDFSTRIPPSLKLKGFTLRHFYKEALRDFLPLQIINKSKHGFGLPFGEWLKSSKLLQELIYANLHALKARDIIRPDYIDQLIASHRSDHAAHYGTMVWVLAMLEQWLQAHRAKF